MKIKKLIIKHHKNKRFKLLRKNNILSLATPIGQNTSIINTKWGISSGVGDNSLVVDATIGNYTNIASNVRIGIRDHIYENFLISDIIYKDNTDNILKPGIYQDNYWVKIGHDVWIGNNVIITRRCEIGTGAIIAAGSVIVKSVPPFAIVGGNPARFLKWRFDKDTRGKLLETNWYEWDEETIIKNREKLQNLVGFNIQDYRKNYYTPKNTII